MKEIEVISPQIKIGDNKIQDFSALYTSLVVPNGNEIKCIALGGSHSKNIHNDESDIDLNIYYMRSLKNLITVTPATLNLIPDSRLKLIEREATTYLYECEEFEVNCYPLFSIGQNIGTQTLQAIYHQNGKVITDILKDYLIVSTAEFDTLRDILMKKFNYSTYAIMGYFNGYMTSQLLKHRRKEDYSKRMCQAINYGNINPVVKAIIEGIYIGLSGVLFCEGKTSRDFEWLWNRYKEYFLVADRDFVQEVFEHKRNIKHITGDTITFISKATEKRNSLFDKIRELQKEYMQKSVFPLELTEREKKENSELINNLLDEWYDLGDVRK